MKFFVCRKYFSHVLILMILFLVSCKPSYENGTDDSEIGKVGIPTDSISIFIMTPMLKSVTQNGNDSTTSYLLLDKIDLDFERNLIVADNSNTVIFKVNLINNQKLFSFGGKGPGPSEFRYIKFLRCDSTRGIIVGDDLSKKCSIFDQRGNLKSTISFYELMDDVVIINDSILIFSNYFAERNYKPIKIYSIKSERIIDSYGQILEPQKNFFEFIARNKSKEYALKETFSYSSLTGLIYLKQENKVILSQTHPYVLWMIDFDSHKFLRFNKKVSFSTYNNLKIEILNDGRMSRTIKKSGKQVHPIIYKEKIVTLIADSTNQEMYLDVYKLSGDFVSRFSVPSLPPDLWVSDFVIDDRKILYVLVHDKNWVSWIERFKIDSNILN